MKRVDFLSTLGLGLAAVCAGGCLAGCGKSGATPVNPGGGTVPPPTPPASVNFSLDLNTDIKSVGESKVNSGVIVVRTAAGNAATSFTAVQVQCSHEGTQINFNSSVGNFVCPNHGSTFSPSGAVLVGPAVTNLKRYNVEVSGTTLTVTS